MSGLSYKGRFDDGDEELSRALRQSTQQICAEPPPAGALEDALHRAAIRAVVEQSGEAGPAEEVFTDRFPQRGRTNPSARSPGLALSIAASLAVTALAAAVL